MNKDERARTMFDRIYFGMVLPVVATISITVGVVFDLPQVERAGIALGAIQGALALNKHYGTKNQQQGSGK